MKLNRRGILVVLAVLLFIGGFSVPAAAGDKAEVTVGFVSRGEIDMNGFTLEKESRVEIKGSLGMFYRNGNELIFYAWILDAKTRDVVWHMLERRGSFDKGLNDFDLSKTLPAGDYEVYYAASQNTSDRYGGRSIIGRIAGAIFDKKDRWRNRKYSSRLKVKVSGKPGVFLPVDSAKLAEQWRKDAVISMTNTGNDYRERKAFELNKKTRLRVYALGEGSGRTTHDYAWITEMGSRRRVWAMTGKNTRHAGGARKNIKLDKTISLPAGKYILHYMTDDSHSYGEWNSLPPDDPQFYGVTLFPASGEDRGKIAVLGEIEEPKPALALIRVTEKEMVSRGFKLSRPMDLRVLCLGEGSRSGRMSDYGWIIDADTRKKVWNMEGQKNRHAGGAEKNRMLDEVVHFESGNYIAYYATDDSHSYARWNSTAPYDPDLWGLSLWVVNEEDRDGIREMVPEKLDSERVIARIVGVRDDQRIIKSFSLDKATKVRIIAIGEGTRSDMSDYGWIENRESGDIVWEMTYRKTDHAGGASKNRMFNGTILLDAGDYKLHYKSDDSHSYMDWNSSPPEDQEGYGITILKEEKK